MVTEMILSSSLEEPNTKFLVYREGREDCKVATRGRQLGGVGRERQHIHIRQ